jgi:thiol-disulfide isomerase/thioredoxin
MSTEISQDRTDARHQGLAARAADLLVEGRMPSLDGSTFWLNSSPVTPEGLRGSVVLVQFWTYTCINWLRTLPYVRAWERKYRDRGLVVIGVHTPEFEFEHELDNVRRAAQAMTIDYPIAGDNDYEIWGAFANHYWPALYFVDAQGRIRHHRFGEGDYERSEMIIQQLLAEAGFAAIPDGLVEVEAVGSEAPADWSVLRSPENYLGYDRTFNFEGPESIAPDAPAVYTAPRRLKLNHWALSGNWTAGPDSAVLNEPGGRIACRFHARDLHLVMGPAAQNGSMRFRVSMDGQPVMAAGGVDVDSAGEGLLVEPRMYQLIRQPSPIVDRQFEIEFFGAPVRAYVFTFG